MANDDHAALANQREDGGESRSNEKEKTAGAEESCVQLGRSRGKGADSQILAIQPAEHPQTNGKKNDVEQQQLVRDEGVDAEKDEDDGVVARKGRQVVIDTRLNLGKVGGLREALEVEKLADGLHVGKTAGERRVTKAGETIANVEARRDKVEGDLNTRHGGGM